MKFCISFVFTLLLYFKVLAQNLPIGDPLMDYLRILELRGQLKTSASWQLQPLRYQWIEKVYDSTKANPWESKVAAFLAHEDSLYQKTIDYNFFTPALFQSMNTTVPSGGNDGALWQGKGYNTSFTSGIWARYRFIEIAFKPEIGYSQNLYYALAPYSITDGRSEFSYPLRDMDYPQRFGDESFSWFDLGNSYIKLFAGPVAFGLSNQHHWFGPSWFNPIMMSNNAPGFSHSFLETAHPVTTPIGTFESRLYWGELKDSDYYYPDREDIPRFISGLIINYSPSFLEGIHLAVIRSFNQYYPDGFKFTDLTHLIDPFYKERNASEDNPSGNDEADQKISLMFRWVIPESGSEIYTEFTRDDHSWDYRDFILEPEHSRAFTLGAVKTLDFSSSQRFLKFHFEMTQLERAKTQLFRGGIIGFYSHNRVKEGYTNEGQIIGAGIGPGANSQFFSTTLFDNQGNLGLFVRRIVNNNDRLLRYPNRIRNEQGINPLTGYRRLHDVELHTGIHAVFFYKKIEFNLNMYRMTQYNRNYVLENDVINYHIELVMRYAIDSFLR